MSTATRRFTRALWAFDAVVQRVDGGAWDNDTPCEHWKAVHVVDHVSFVCDMVRRMALGGDVGIKGGKGGPTAVDGYAWDETFLEDYPYVVGGAQVHDAWPRQRDRVLEAIDDPVALTRETVSPWRKETVDSFVGWVSFDLFTHTWDLGIATGVDPALTPEFATEIRPSVERFREQADQLPAARRVSVVGEPHTCATNDPVAQLLALLGRDPEWRPPSTVATVAGAR